MIPRGVILDCCCVLMGANAGTLLRNKIPAKFQEPLMVIFGMCAIAIGMVSVIKLDRRIKTGFLHGLHHLHFKIEGDKEFICGFIWWWQ